MECAPGAVEAFEWLGLSWADRWLIELGATSTALAAVHRLAAVDDLRHVDLASEALRYGLTYSFLLHALLVRGDCVDVTPFEHDVPLGQLAATPIYRSDTRGQGEGKAHGPGCQHHRKLYRDDDLLTLSEWVERRSDAAGEASWSRAPCPCSRCGGFAIRRLDNGQLSYWRAAHEVYQAGKVIEACGSDRASEQCDRTLRTFTRLGCVLDRHQAEPVLAQYVKDLRVRYEAIARRGGMRLP